MVLHDIAVGLDGSPASSDALRWATGLAEATSASVRALSSWRMPLIASAPRVIGGLPSQAFMANYCAESLEKALIAAGAGPDMPREIREGDPGPILAEETAVADLVVVGRTGSGRRRGAARVAESMLGSTARHCIHHARGPVASVPKDQQWVVDPTVVVGVDGSPASHSALAWAVENLPSSATIYAVRAVPPYLEALLAFDHKAIDRILEATDEELDTSIRHALAHLGPDAMQRIEPCVLVENARYALLDPGFDVHLLVVGERGHGAVAARVLGSITDHAVRYASCPVVVVPTTKPEEVSA